MDFLFHNIKTFVSLAAPKKHTKHKTMRAPCDKRGQASRRADKPPPAQCFALGGLLNEFLMAVDLASSRKTGRLFLFLGHLPCRLSVWECYIAKYP